MILAGIGIAGSQQIILEPVVQCFTTNTTWACCPGTVCIEVVAVGAGGAGGCGGGDQSFNFGSLGGVGGGGGGVSICVLTSGFGSSQCVIVGSGNSCFGSLVCATKGADGAVGLTNVSAGTTNACAAGGVGNFAIGGFGGNSCVVNAQGCGGAGGAGVNAPGGGGGASQGFLSRPGQFDPVCALGGPGGAGGAGATLCGITLGSGGLGGNNPFNCPSVVTCVDAVAGSSFGGGGGGGAARSEFVTRKAGAAGAPGIIKVTQFFG